MSLFYTQAGYGKGILHISTFLDSARLKSFKKYLLLTGNIISMVAFQVLFPALYLLQISYTKTLQKKVE
jgi:hypothetical protein